jgi:hypothetical protein
MTATATKTLKISSDKKSVYATKAASAVFYRLHHGQILPMKSAVLSAVREAVRQQISTYLESFPSDCTVSLRAHADIVRLARKEFNEFQKVWTRNANKPEFRDALMYAAKRASEKFCGI